MNASRIITVRSFTMRYHLGEKCTKAETNSGTIKDREIGISKISKIGASRVFYCLIMFCNIQETISGKGNSVFDTVSPIENVCPSVLPKSSQV